MRTAKVNKAQLLRIPVVSVRWLEECVKFWKLAPLDLFYMDFAQDDEQRPLFGKVAIDGYHNAMKMQADTRLFTNIKAEPTLSIVFFLPSPSATDPSKVVGKHI